MNWELFPQFFMTGLLTGGVYALVALGLVLIYKSSRIFNFAQGHLMMVGAFITWWFVENLGFDVWIAFGAAIVTTALLGLGVERVALRPLIGQPILATIMMTLALSQVLQGATILLFGASDRALPNLFPLQPVIIGDLRLKLNLVMAFLVAMLGFASFVLFFRFTKAGLAMRAAAEDHQLAQSVGLSVPRIFGLAWMIAGLVAAIGGVLLASISGLSLVLSLIALKAFAAVLFGGLESIPGAIIGGLTVGVIESLAAGLPADPAIRALNLGEIAPYVLLLLVLFIRPDGLFGLKRIERI
ncbi:High-affinity branched-chain amino acid transport system permease protein LivH [Anaerolineae bacterium]|nr:High-affinity branched-chain amino acid transport system permease protein LivH [Anaerolineae bacterium]